MSSKLESEYLVPEGLTAISGIEFKPNQVVIELASFESSTIKGKLHFPDSALRSLDVVYSSDDLQNEPSFLDFPWDYYGFDSRSKDNGRWEFTLVSCVLEIVFEADWPIFTKE